MRGKARRKQQPSLCKKLDPASYNKLLLSTKINPASYYHCQYCSWQCKPRMIPNIPLIVRQSSPKETLRKRSSNQAYKSRQVSRRSKTIRLEQPFRQTERMHSPEQEEARQKESPPNAQQQPDYKSRWISRQANRMRLEQTFRQTRRMHWPEQLGRTNHGRKEKQAITSYLYVRKLIQQVTTIASKYCSWQCKPRMIPNIPLIIRQSSPKEILRKRSSN